MLDIPLEILEIIVKCMDLETAIELSKTCKLLHRLVFDNIHLFIIRAIKKITSDDEIRIYGLCEKTDNIYKMRPENLLALYYIIAFQYNMPYSKFCQRWIALNEYKITQRFTTGIRQDLLSFSYGEKIDITIHGEEYDSYYRRQKLQGFKNCMICDDLILTDYTIMKLILKDYKTYNSICVLSDYIIKNYNTVPAIMLLLGGAVPGRKYAYIRVGIRRGFKDSIFGGIKQLYHDIFTTLD